MKMMLMLRIYTETLEETDKELKSVKNIEALTT